MCSISLARRLPLGKAPCPTFARYFFPPCCIFSFHLSNVAINILKKIENFQGIITAPLLFAMEEFPELRAVFDQGFDSSENVDCVSRLLT